MHDVKNLLVIQYTYKTKEGDFTVDKSAVKEVLRRETRESDGARYVYTLSSGTGKSVASYSLTLYSVGIEMTDRNGKRTEASLDEIFTDSKRAFRFFNRLVENFATPIDLPYVLEDEMR